MDKCPPDGPDELEWHLAYIQRLRAEKVALFRKDPKAWEEQEIQSTGRWGRKAYTVSFIKGDPDCLPDDYRYADICPPRAEVVERTGPDSADR